VTGLKPGLNDFLAEGYFKNLGEMVNQLVRKKVEVIEEFS